MLGIFGKSRQASEEAADDGENSDTNDAYFELVEKHELAREVLDEHNIDGRVTDVDSYETDDGRTGVSFSVFVEKEQEDDVSIPDVVSLLKEIGLGNQRTVSNGDGEDAIVLSARISTSSDE